MKKLISTVKKNNKGISLVEILATIAIIAIIAAPLINSFISAMKVNSEARTIQNGTAVAQDTAEIFKTFSLETLIDDYTGSGVEIEEDETTGKYTFKNIKVTGADGETFLATVELNPTVYSGGESVKLQVNNVDLPVFSGLFGSDSVMLYRQYAGFDDQLKELFTGKLKPLFEAEGNAAEKEAEILDNLDKAENRGKFSKVTDVYITCTYDSTRDEYDYSFDLNMTYTYDSASSVSVSKSLKKIYKGGQIHSVYMIAPIFDFYSYTDAGKDCYYNTDRINVIYTYSGLPEKKQDLYFYIAEQEMYNIGYDSSVRERINPRNLTVNGTQYTMYSPEHDNVKLYTNIGDTDLTFNNDYGLTYGNCNSGNSLYQMDITVKLEGQENTIATFSTTK